MCFDKSHIGELVMCEAPLDPPTLHSQVPIYYPANEE